ncbi:MAG: diaminopimelate decarboxylase [Melioribacteraceae bacterium]|nr:MAG: diaminopimelate decarboxylase [Melioribacteraceae bacterium]
MKLFDSQYFTYQNGEMFCEDLSVRTIAKEYGTPVYIYSKKFFTDKFTEFTNAFKDINHTIFFASKSNFNINVMKLFYDLGAGIDVNSGGELFRALKAGVDPKRMLLTGVGKTREEIKTGLELDIKIIKAESIQEVYTISEIAGQLGKTAEVALRVNPDVDAETHPYITTALAENKFGIDAKIAFDTYMECAKLPNIKLTGIDMHIGSQITKVSPFVEAVAKLNDLIEKLRNAGINIEHLDIGGGMGVTYNDETPFTPEQFADALIPLFEKSGCEIIFEPGRSLTANGGILLTETLYTKNNGVKNFIVVDGSMTDLLRPSIYGSYHHIQPTNLAETDDVIKADIVGPVCESGDFLAKNREIFKVNQGDLLAVMSAGAYGMTMASNYNARRRPPEILVDGDKHYVIRGRETYEHLLYDENIVEL